MRGATSRHDDQVIPLLSFLLTRPMRGATIPCLYLIFFESISTHTPLARRDVVSICREYGVSDFYSHASCEARPAFHAPFYSVSPFLLTRLLRGATGTPPSTAAVLSNFYSHASCEARPSVTLMPHVVENFYSHASCEARQQRHRRKYLG